MQERSKLNARISDASDLAALFTRKVGRSDKSESQSEKHSEEEHSHEHSHEEEHSHEHSHEEEHSHDDHSESSNESESESESEKDDVFIRRGWLKFFTYVPEGDSDSIEKPTKFEFNAEYAD